ncbi:unnamed protein product [Caenorhabditis angaria]|uniref:Cadherin domain-containing protein n=1 Tax=Caenorhabditis angaria TaxID=860376 RepID=A0A9P1N4J8_9PELO|nr:unnamed protein product [Caenorhabditis angaria]
MLLKLLYLFYILFLCSISGAQKNEGSSEVEGDRSSVPDKFDQPSYGFMLPEGFNENSTLLAVVDFITQKNHATPKIAVNFDELNWFDIGGVQKTKADNADVYSATVILKAGSDVKVDRTDQGIYKFVVEAQLGDNVLATTNVVVEVLALAPTTKRVRTTEDPIEISNVELSPAENDDDLVLGVGTEVSTTTSEASEQSTDASTTTSEPTVAVEVTKTSETTSESTPEQSDITESEELTETSSEPTVSVEVTTTSEASSESTSEPTETSDESTTSEISSESTIDSASTIEPTVAVEVATTSDESTTSEVSMAAEVITTPTPLENDPELLTNIPDEASGTQESPTPASDDSLEASATQPSEIESSGELLTDESPIESPITILPLLNHIESVDLEIEVQGNPKVLDSRAGSQIRGLTIVPKSGARSTVTFSIEPEGLEIRPKVLRTGEVSGIFINENFNATRKSYEIVGKLGNGAVVRQPLNLEVEKSQSSDKIYELKEYEFAVLESAENGRTIGRIDENDMKIIGDSAKRFSLVGNSIILTCSEFENEKCLENSGPRKVYSLMLLPNNGTLAPIQVTIKVQQKPGHLRTSDDVLRISDNRIIIPFVILTDVEPRISGTASRFLGLRKTLDMYQVQVMNSAASGKYELEIHTENDNASKKIVPVFVENSQSHAHFRKPKYSAKIDSSKITEGKRITQVELEGVPIDEAKIIILSGNPGWVTVEGYGGRVKVNSFDGEVYQGKYTLRIGAIDKKTLMILTETELEIEVVNGKMKKEVEEEVTAKLLETTFDRETFVENFKIPLESPDFVLLSEDSFAINEIGKREIYEPMNIKINKNTVEIRKIKGLRIISFNLINKNTKPIVLIRLISTPAYLEKQEKLRAKPIYPKELMEVDMPEEIGEGRIVGVFPAVIPTTNQRTRSRIEGAMREAFNFNEETGELRIKKVIDYESLPVQQRSFDLKLISGEKGYESEGILRIHVVDIDDNTPLITREQINTVSLPEDLPGGAKIAEFDVTDPDGSRSFEVHLEGRGSEQYFANITNAGLLSIFLAQNGKLDREARDSNALIVRVEDMSGNSDRVIIPIQILDVNDNAPRFSRKMYEVEAVENWPKGVVLEKIQATDPDLGPSGNIHFSLEGSPPNLLSINETSGLLTISGDLMGLSRAEPYAIRIIAQDSGSPALNSSAVLNLRVRSKDELMSQPIVEFVNLENRFEVEENIPDSQKIAKIEARVKGSREDGISLEYTLKDLISAQESFQIDKTSGEIFATRPIDYEATQDYTVSWERVLISKSTYDLADKRNNVICFLFIFDRTFSSLFLLCLFLCGGGQRSKEMGKLEKIGRSILKKINNTTRRRALTPQQNPHQTSSDEETENQKNQRKKTSSMPDVSYVHNFTVNTEPPVPIIRIPPPQQSSPRSNTTTSDGGYTTDDTLNVEIKSDSQGYYSASSLSPTLEVPKRYEKYPRINVSSKSHSDLLRAIEVPIILPDPSKSVSNLASLEPSDPIERFLKRSIYKTKMITTVFEAKNGGFEEIYEDVCDEIDRWFETKNMMAVACEMHWSVPKEKRSRQLECKLKEKLLSALRENNKRLLYMRGMGRGKTPIKLAESKTVENITRDKPTDSVRGIYQRSYTRLLPYLHKETPEWHSQYWTLKDMQHLEEEQNNNNNLQQPEPQHFLFDERDPDVLENTSLISLNIIGLSILGNSRDFQLLVTATNPADPTQTASTIIHLDILNLEDNSPEFPKSATRVFKVPSNTSKSTAIGRIVAYDADKKPIFYYIIPSCGSEMAANFTIDHEFGEIVYHPQKPTTEVSGRVEICILADSRENVDLVDVFYDSTAKNMQKITVEVHSDENKVDVEKEIVVEAQKIAQVGDSLQNIEIPIDFNSQAQDFELETINFVPANYELGRDMISPEGSVELNKNTGELAATPRILDAPQGIYIAQLKNERGIRELHHIRDDRKLKYVLAMERNEFGANMEKLKRQLREALKSMDVYFSEPLRDSKNSSYTSVCFYITKDNAILEDKQMSALLSNTNQYIDKIHHIFKVVNVDQCTQAKPLQISNDIPLNTLILISIVAVLILILVALVGYICCVARYRRSLEEKLKTPYYKSPGSQSYAPTSTSSHTIGYY